jgi:hypothetical protein
MFCGARAPINQEGGQKAKLGFIVRVKNVTTNNYLNAVTY